jgi:putative addiction module killer protein
MKIRRTDEFDKWLKKLQDQEARVRINMRVKRLGEGNPGDCWFLGGISKLRIDYGPSYRVYFTQRGRELVIILCGGDKSTQAAGIERARALAKQPLEQEE